MPYVVKYYFYDCNLLFYYACTGQVLLHYQYSGHTTWYILLIFTRFMDKHKHCTQQRMCVYYSTVYANYAEFYKMYIPQCVQIYNTIYTLQISDFTMPKPVQHVNALTHIYLYTNTISLCICTSAMNSLGCTSIRLKAVVFTYVGMGATAINNILK